MPIRSIRTPVLLAAGLVLPSLGASQSAAPSGPRVTVGGFVSSTMFAQNQAFGFGNGQNAEWAAAQRTAGDRWFVGGDVRSSRLSLSVAGIEPADSRWRAKGSVEIDFFGGFNGTSAFSDEQPHPRLRSVYADLTDGRTTLRVGQAFSPLFGNAPVSLAHVAFPLGYGSGGVIGWRHPGVFVSRRMTGDSAPIRVDAQVAVMRGSWSGPGSTLDQQSAGEAGRVPQLELRIDLGGSLGGSGRWSAYAVGHYDEKDLSGVGPDTAAAGELVGWAMQAGAKVVTGPLTLHGNAYRGRAIGQQFGHISQFGDIGGWGAWAQAGVALTSRMSVWAFTGIDDPQDADVLAETTGAARTRNLMHAGMVRYMVGPYALGLEYLRSSTSWVRAHDAATEPETHTGDQVAFSVMFTF